MKFIIHLFLLFFILSTNAQEIANCGLNFKAENNYFGTKTSVQNTRNKLAKKYHLITDSTKKSQFLDSANAIFTSLLLNEIVPYWYGTTWDFNGYTAVPNQGTIACGYFVSTTLKDVGINLNRYKLAQQNPENEAKSIAIQSSDVVQIEEKDIKETLKNLADGLYFVGLDNHVGYLYIKNNISYFLHSNYRDGKVMIETTASSLTFGSSRYYISKISNNKELTKKWLNQQEIKVFL